MEQFFFFSSRRRHTRWNCDWSSDVCSSDLGLVAAELVAVGVDRQLLVQGDLREVLGERRSGGHVARLARSEERRVGKEWRCGWWRGHAKKRACGISRACVLDDDSFAVSDTR